MKTELNLHHYVKITLFTLLLLLSGCGGSNQTQRTDNNQTQPTDGNQTQSTIKDKISPEITILGDKKVFLSVGDTYQDPGAIATDSIDGDISTSIQTTSNINFNTPGEYTITYQVSDKDGNSVIVTRKIMIQDIITSPQPRAGLTINEILTANTYSELDPKFKQFSDWIELYNNDNSAKDIGGYYLSDDVNNSRKWKIPSGTMIGSKDYLLIWADKEDTGLHTNFSLSADGEIVTLSDLNGNIVDSVEFDKQRSDVSCSKINDKIYYMKPTPANANGIAHGELWSSKKPDFSLQSGFYDGTQTIELTQKKQGAIYYTTNGSIPTKNSTKYTQPISINKTTVIRARALENGKFLSSIKNRTYLINENITLPVVSLAIDDKYLYDEKTGIYTVGTDENGNPHPTPEEDDDWDSANYFRNWMRPASIEYFKDGKSKFSENVGLRIYGDGSRKREQKSLAIFAKDKYGSKSINYKLFPDRNIKKIKSFTLRRSDERTNLRDGLSQTIIKDVMDLDYQSYHPTVVFINGQYWGILNVREKLNEAYLEAHHNVDPDAINIITPYSETVYRATSGTATEYTQLIQYIKDNSSSASTDTFYEHISSKIDLKNYLNYIITQNFVNNTDWAIRNIKFWKEQKEDSKWRWMLYDLDSAFWDVRDNPFVFSLALDGIGYINPAWSTYFQRSLLDNSKIQNEFISKFTSHLYTTFQPSRIEGIIDKLANQLKPEIQRHFAKWPEDNPVTNFDSSLSSLYGFAQERQDIMRGHLASQFGVSGNNILEIQKNQNGTIYLDDIKLDDTFSGHYFNNAKVTIKAVANIGYKFSRWTGDNTSSTSEISLTINSDTTIGAVFEVVPMPSIVINEINYKSSSDFDTKDWLELYNYGDTSISLSGWEIKDNNDNSSFIIPNNTTLTQNSYLIISQDRATFQVYYTNITNVLGDFQFGLGRDGDTVRLYNSEGTLIDSVTYNQSWPNADANGKTLSLVNPQSDNTLPDNWIADNNHGTPGTDN